MKKIFLWLIFGTIFSTDASLKKLTEDEKAFLQEANQNNVNQLKKYLKKGININVEDELLKDTALIKAIRNDYIDAANFLVDHNIDLNITTNQNRNPLNLLTYYFVENFKLKNILPMIKMLLSNNADYSIKNNEGETALSMGIKNTVLKKLFNEIILYKKEVLSDKKDEALVNAITHNGNNDSEFTKEQWLRLALLRKDHKQLLYALNKDVVSVDDILSLIAAVPRMPLDFIPQLFDTNKIEFKDLKKYYDIAKKEDNVKFGKYYVKLQNILGKPKKSQPLSEDVLPLITKFLPVEDEKEEKKE